MAQQHIDLGTVPTGIGGDTPRSAFQKCEDNFNDLFPQVDALSSQVDGISPLVDALSPLLDARCAIGGLKIVRTAANELSVSPGWAYVPALERLVGLAASKVTSGIVVAAATWLHGYLYEDGEGNGAIEWTTTAPAAPYSGPARTKSGDDTRRYIGSVRSIGANTLARFVHNTGDSTISYVEDINQSFLRLLVNGTSTSSVNVSCANCVPVSARLMSAVAENVADSSLAIAFIANPDAGAASGSNILAFLRQGAMICADLALDSSLQFNYARNAASTGGLSVWCRGYAFER